METKNDKIQIMKKINFRWVAFSFLAFLLGLNMARGIFAGKWDYIFAISLIVVALVGFGIYKKTFVKMLTIIGFLLFGIGWCYVGIASFSCPEYDGVVAVEGRVTESITEGKYYSKVILDDVKINGENASNISLTISNGDIDLEVGQILSFDGELENANAFSLGNFNSFYHRSGVRYLCKVDGKDVSVRNGYLKFDEMIRLAVKGSLENNMGYDNAQTAYASLFGDKTNLDDGIYQTYKDVGIVHILTVSGLHVSFMIALIFGALKKCRVNRFVSFGLTCAFILFYSYLCNFSPSVVRAGVMGIIFMLAKLMGKRYDGLNSLGIAGFAICLFSPLSGLDFGFLMSVFCVLAIFVVMPLFRKGLSRFLPRKCAELFALSLSAQIGVFPMMCLMGGSVNLLSVFANFLIVPIFSLLFPFLFVVSFLATILPFASKLLVIADFGFSLIFYIASIFLCNFAIIDLKRLEFLKITLFYSILFVASRFFMVQNKERILALLVLLFAYFVSFSVYYFAPIAPEKISYLCQYNQTSIVCRSENGQVLAVGDCSLTDRFSQVYNCGFDGLVLTENISSARVEKYEQMGISALVGCGVNAEKSTNILPNQNYIIGDYCITYLSKNGQKVDGIRINFDQIEIFIATNEKLQYNEFRAFHSQYDFDIVFADLQMQNEDFVQVSMRATNGADYCHQKQGNLAFCGNDLTVRSLD